MGKSRSDGGGTSWRIDMDNTGKPRVRIDSQPIGSGPGTTGFNQSWTSPVGVEDGQWHHLAFTYQHDTKTVRLYVDYVERRYGNSHSNLVYQTDVLRIGQGAGGRSFDGWIDEVRISDEVLLPQDFITQHLYPTGTMILIF
ncbi:MAG: LamG domain-containing protein [Kiritimatiellae bacterium]|nr:LamG domain-containing protein [Kiritimatiellia bacterium]